MGVTTTRLRSWLVPVALVGLVAAPVATAATRTIVVTSNSISLVNHDVSPKGASKGDTITYRDRLLNATVQFGRKKGAPVGSDTGRLTFTSAHTANFSGSARLPGGTLELAGAVVTNSAGQIVIPVTGGTGEFANVSGTLTVGSGRDHVRNTYRLTRSTGPVA